MALRPGREDRRATLGISAVKETAARHRRFIDERAARRLALWAAACAEHVIGYFEAVRPRDRRPHRAIAVCRAWGRGEIPFSMALVRRASLAAHAAARAVRNPAARAAARAAGHAVGTAHCPAHAYGAAHYALVCVAALGPDAIERERRWQKRRYPRSVRRRYGWVARTWRKGPGRGSKTSA